MGKNSSNFKNNLQNSRRALGQLYGSDRKYWMTLRGSIRIPYLKKVKDFYTYIRSV